MKRIILLIILTNILTYSSYSQSNVFHLFKSNEELGDKHFAEFSYIKAKDAYLKAANDDKGRADLQIKVAETYRMLNDPENSSQWYAKALNSGDAVKSIYKLHYAEALSSMKQYDKAKKWYAIYKEEAEHDGRGHDKVTRLDNHHELLDNPYQVVLEPVDFNSEYADFSPTIHNEEIYFVSARPTAKNKATSPTYNWDHSDYLEIYVLDKDKKLSLFHKDINSKYHEGPLAFYENGSKMLFTRNNYYKKSLKKDDVGVSKLKIYSCELKANGKDWTDPVELHFNSDQFSVGHPAISEDGNTLYFVSDMPGGHGGTDIYKVTKNSDNQWNTPVNLGNSANTEGNEMFPYLYKDKFLFFTSNGHGGLGGLDLFVVNLHNGKDAIIKNLGSPINTSFDDFGIVLNHTGKEGYLSSNRKDSKHNDDIYKLTAQRPIVGNYTVTGTVFDNVTKEKIPHALIMISSAGNQPIEVKCDENGKYEYELQPGNEYLLNANADNFLPKKDLLEIAAQATQTEYNKDFYLDNGYSLYGVIADYHTKEPLDGVSVEVQKVNDESKKDYKTPQVGDFEHIIKEGKIGETIPYQLKFMKSGYADKNIMFHAKLDKPGRINLNSVLKNVNLEMVKTGTDIGKLLNVNPIYFDLGKSNIRPDAAIELDKIVNFMDENHSIKLELNAHTDARGSKTINNSLSDKRAKSSANYIISQGIDQKRIVGKGYGESKIINKCTDGIKCTEEEHQLNRRTEFIVVEY